MSHQDEESKIWYEDEVLANTLALPSRYREEEEEYDVYLFWPSSPESHVLLSERLSQDWLVEVRPLCLLCLAAPSELTLQASSPTLYQPSEGSEHDTFAYPTIYRPSIDSEDGMAASSIIPVRHSGFASVAFVHAHGATASVADLLLHL